jgi:hypothetical protein
MEKDPENNPNSADKDYGFPFVKVEPLSSPLQNEASAQRSDGIDKVAEQIDTFDKPVAKPTAIKFESKEKPERKKKSQVPLLFSLVLLILIVLASMAYFLYYLPSQEEEIQTAESTDIKIEEPQTLPETVETENVPEVAIDSLTAEVVETPPTSVPSPTNESASGGQLIVLNAKEEVRYYHLVVASLPNERIAREEAQVFLDKGKDIYLIFPSGDTRNYRLSVGKYSSFKAASEALPTAKADFNESTWILKY